MVAGPDFKTSEAKKHESADDSNQSKKSRLTEVVNQDAATQGQQAGVDASTSNRRGQRVDTKEPPKAAEESRQSETASTANPTSRTQRPVMSSPAPEVPLVVALPHAPSAASQSEKANSEPAAKAPPPAKTQKPGVSFA